MRYLSLILVLTSMQAQAIDAFSSIENFFGSKDESEENFIERTADRGARFTPLSPGDSDLGEQLILQREEKVTHFQLTLQSALYRTDNVFAAASDTDSSFLWFNSAEVSWRPTLAPNLIIDSFISAQSFVFEEDAVLNFESYLVGLGLVKVFPELGGLVVFGRYEFQNVQLDQSITPNPTQFHILRFGAYKELFDTRRHHGYVSIGTRFDLDSTPSSVSRDEYALRLGYSYTLTDKLKANGFYRIGRRNFQHIDRDDTFQMIGADLTYEFSRSLLMTASALWTENDSDSSPFAQDYHSIQLGLAVSYQHKF